MVYCGKLSKGCERCRLRKVRCDQRTPGCKRCDKSGTACPGYRDLGQVMFRDESARTIEKARRDNQLDSLDVVNIRLEGSELPVQSPAAQRAETGVPFLAPPLARPLQRPLGQMAADFFFNNFVFEGPLLSDNNSHLTMSIYRDHSQSAAFDAIEAVGLAGLSNVLRDRHLRYEAQRRYGRALTKTNGLLGDPDEARSDLTAMSILLLGQFESMTVESWDQYDRLVVHVEGASALIKLRGEKQFERESGVRLYFALRFQIVRARVLPHLLPFWPVQLLVDLLTGYHDYQLTDCMQRELPVPDSLLEAGKALQNSPVKRPRSSRTSMGDVYVRYVNIIAAMKATWPPDRQLLLEEINVLEKALQEWRLGIYPDCDFTTVQGAGFTDGDKCDMPSADGRRHVYKVRWSAHVWNKWRIMRMMIYRLKLDYGMVDDRQQCETAIREASMDICLSVPSLLASSRAPTLIWPLYMVSQEALNNHCVRDWAIRQLRHIDDTMGIRQAALLADLAQTDLENHYPSALYNTGVSATGCEGLSHLWK